MKWIVLQNNIYKKKTNSGLTDTLYAGSSRG